MIFGTARELFTLAACLYGYSVLINNWSSFDSCYAPTQYFFLSAISVIFVDKFCFVLLKRSFTPVKVKRIIGFFVSFIINPAFLIITFKGIEWQIQNSRQAGNCSVVSEKSWLVWLTIGILAITDFVILFYLFSHVILWKRYRNMRRRHTNANEFQILEEYINGGLYQAFLAHELQDEANSAAAEERVITLTPQEVHHIPRRMYNALLDKERQGFEDTCPVCFEEYKDGEELCILPQCNHAFHSRCINNWFSISALCPMCRCNVKENLAKSFALGHITPIAMESAKAEILDADGRQVETN